MGPVCRSISVTDLKRFSCKEGCTTLGPWPLSFPRFVKDWVRMNKVPGILMQTKFVFSLTKYNKRWTAIFVVHVFCCVVAFYSTESIESLTTRQIRTCLQWIANCRPIRCADPFARSIFGCTHPVLPFIRFFWQRFIVHSRILAIAFSNKKNLHVQVIYTPHSCVSMLPNSNQIDVDTFYLITLLDISRVINVSQVSRVVCFVCGNRDIIRRIYLRKLWSKIYILWFVCKVYLNVISSPKCYISYQTLQLLSFFLIL